MISLQVFIAIFRFCASAQNLCSSFFKITWFVVFSTFWMCLTLHCCKKKETYSTIKRTAFSFNAKRPPCRGGCLWHNAVFSPPRTVRTSALARCPEQMLGERRQSQLLLRQWEPRWMLSAALTLSPAQANFVSLAARRITKWLFHWS